MSTFFNTVHITNFKSLKDVTLSDCKRINLLIGKPNVGKSNILEAIGLFSLPYMDYYAEDNKFSFIRSENIGELFFDGNIEDDICIKLDDDTSCTIQHEKQYRQTSLIFSGERFGFELIRASDDKIPSINCNISAFPKIGSINSSGTKNSGSISFYNLSLLTTIKFYRFSDTAFYETNHNSNLLFDYLIPPFGINFVEVFRKNNSLKKELSNLFKAYNLRFLFDKGTNSLRIVKDTPDGEIFSIPYSSIADTLQRVIFFKTAIASNKDSIILFEEPEAHCFPPFIRHITQEIIESESNQFFIATHSPYVLNDFLEYQRDDVAIFMADFKDGQTVIKRLTDSEVNDVYGYGIDLFFNSELFTDEI